MITLILNTLNSIQSLWEKFQKLNNTFKNIVILIILIITGYIAIQNAVTKSIQEVYFNKEEQQKEQEQIAISKSKQIANCIESIKNLDNNCSNVLLLNYHNTSHSLQGFSYIYLNCISEGNHPTKNEEVIDYWHDLQYINYQTELSYIKDLSYLQVEDIDKIEDILPKFYKKLKLSNARAAGFYPIEGVNTTIGMLVIIYTDTQKWPSNYYAKTLAPQIQKISTLLDD